MIITCQHFDRLETSDKNVAYTTYFNVLLYYLYQTKVALYNLQWINNNTNTRGINMAIWVADRVAAVECNFLSVRFFFYIAMHQSSEHMYFVEMNAHPKTITMYMYCISKISYIRYFSTTHKVISYKRLTFENIHPSKYSFINRETSFI